MRIKEQNEWFTIDADPQAREVRIMLRGLWSDATLVSFEAALQRWITKLTAAGAPYGSHRTLVDIREQALLTQAVADLAKGLGAGPGAASERIAVVVANTLHKLQQVRISSSDHLKVFTDYAEAEA